nr:hypothetical protein [Thiomicrorhabdus indica]
MASIGLAKSNVKLLAIIIGKLLSEIPYISQKMIPNENRIYVVREMLSVFLVFNVFIAWGINAIAVNIPAK